MQIEKLYGKDIDDILDFKEFSEKFENQPSEDFLKEVPILTALFQPIKGAALTSHIMFISKDVMEVKVDGFEERIIMNKKY